MAVTGFIGGGLKLEFLAGAISDASSVTGPSGILAGDLLILADFAYNTSAVTPADVVPSGFERIETLNNASARQTLSLKIATGSEASASLSGLSGTGSQSKCLAAMRPSKPLTAYSVVKVTGQFVIGDPSARVIEASDGVPALVAVAAYTVGVTPFVGIDPRTFTVDGVDAKDGEVSNPGGGGQIIETHLAFKFMNSRGRLADVTIDMEAEGVNPVSVLQGCYIEVSA